MSIDSRWLETGHHWSIHFERDEAPDNAGPFIDHGGWKFLVHITVSPWGAIDSMKRVLNDKRAQPHLLLGGRPGIKHPVCIQMLPFDVAGRALQNDTSDGFQTNRARCVQMEICASPGRTLAALNALNLPDQIEFDPDHPPDGTDLFTLDGYYLNHHAESLMAGVPGIELCMTSDGDETARAKAAAFASGVESWGDNTYKAIANVFELVRHRVPISNKVPRAFSNEKRFTDKGFEEVGGIVGHGHTPDNTHIDPTKAFKGQKVVKFTKTAPNTF